MDNFLKCKLCDFIGTDFDSFGSHIKSSHKISIKNYIPKYLPKYDLLDGSLIPFKSYEQYLHTDFLNKKNLKAWFIRQPDEDKISYMGHKIKEYLSLKNMYRAPSYVESALINNILSIKNIEDLCGLSYNDFCTKLEIHCPFNYSLKRHDMSLLNVDKIIVDTREQKPFAFQDLDIKNLKLEYGDYAFESNTRIAIERKCYSDFISTFSSGVERFQKEITRAKNDNGYLVVVCESTLSNILYSKYQRYGMATPQFLAHNLRKLLRNNDNLQFVFSSNRREAESRSLEILKLGENIRKLDLQYYFNYGID